MPRTKKAAHDDGPDYSQLRRQLDDIVDKLQDPECDVDEAATLYEQALQAITKLERHLQAAENRVQRAQADFGGQAG